MRRMGIFTVIDTSIYSTISTNTGYFSAPNKRKQLNAYSLKLHGYTSNNNLSAPNVTITHYDECFLTTDNNNSIRNCCIIEKGHFLWFRNSKFVRKLIFFGIATIKCYLVTFLLDHSLINIPSAGTKKLLMIVVV